MIGCQERDQCTWIYEDKLHEEPTTPTSTFIREKRKKKNTQHNQAWKVSPIGRLILIDDEKIGFDSIYIYIYINIHADVTPNNKNTKKARKERRR